MDTEFESLSEVTYRFAFAALASLVPAIEFPNLIEEYKDQLYRAYFEELFTCMPNHNQSDYSLHNIGKLIRRGLKIFRRSLYKKREKNDVDKKVVSAIKKLMANIKWVGLLFATRRRGWRRVLREHFKKRVWDPVDPWK